MAALLLTSCSSSRPAMIAALPARAAATTAEWSFEKEAIRIRLSGDSRLNLFQNTPHALVSCLYQLRDPNAFNQLADEPDGLAKLLECGRFDPSVAVAKRLVVQPRQRVEESLDRAEGARYLGYVAGYYVLHKEKVLHLVRIPVKEISVAGETRQTPGKVTFDLRLTDSAVIDNSVQLTGGAR